MWAPYSEKLVRRIPRESHSLNSLYFRERIGYAYTINLGATSMPSVPPFTKKDAQSAAKAGVDKSAIVKALRTPRPPVQESGCSQPKK